MQRSIATVAAVAFLSTAALAASVHFKPRSPVFTDQGVVLLMQGTLTGLGNGDITVMLSASAGANTTCTNQGGNQAPGQNPGDVTVAGVQIIPDNQIKNGNVSLNVSTQPPAVPTFEQAGCPSKNWTAAITDLDFTTATVVVVQGGVIVFQETFSL
jgi:hypothetical protein